ncbi:hypothetical protein [Rhizobium leguminosarum]|uniref:hypothetical protein n=1 Tax=Rhizobium leguminosarum TaxID=384 RepID=UPI001C984EC1|nr:hypothetical protein [Rhizobium leguminosarum]MBY5415374.1 hypothetical protein [Rhizobium leguminosarum]
MDPAFFLRRRTGFIARYYAAAIAPFREIQRKIDAEESPYKAPPPLFDPEYGEPPYLEQWIEADEASQVVGWSAVSLLSDSLKLYFKALEQVLQFQLGAEGKTIVKKAGFVAAYRTAIGEILDTDWANCPVRFDVIEQVVLARNRTQHGDHLSILGVRHDSTTLEKHQNPIFANDNELKMWVDEGADPDTWIAPQLEITTVSLGTAIVEVEKLAFWIDKRIPDAMARRHKRETP